MRRGGLLKLDSTIREATGEMTYSIRLPLEEEQYPFATRHELRRTGPGRTLFQLKFRSLDDNAHMSTSTSGAEGNAAEYDEGLVLELYTLPTGKPPQDCFGDYFSIP